MITNMHVSSCACYRNDKMYHASSSRRLSYGLPSEHVLLLLLFALSSHVDIPICSVAENCNVVFRNKDLRYITASRPKPYTLDRRLCRWPRVAGCRIYNNMVSRAAEISASRLPHTPPFPARQARNGKKKIKQRTYNNIQFSLTKTDHEK